MKKILIQFNEANFDVIKKYCSSNKLPSFQKLLNNFKSIETSSEKEYKNLEPWIQWYSFYSNLKFEEHDVFNLGDCLKNNHDNFLIDEASKGNKVGVFCAMNCRPSDKFHTYLPDPWTEAEVKAGFFDKAVFNVVKKLVNENAKLEISFKDMLGIIILIGIPNTFDDISIIFNAIKSFFKKDRAALASIFDYFFGKYSLKRTRKSELDLSIFFLNGLAHVQHHYMLNSSHVEGTNPLWYSNNNDSLLESLKIYDKLFKYIDKKFSKSHELWVITGLSQEAYPDPFIYWRFKNHKELLNKFIDFDFTVYPRMTRDFEVHFDQPDKLETILKFLNNAQILSGDKNIGKAFINIDITSKKSIFASFAYSGSTTNIELLYENKKIPLENEINFIALKNGGHIQKGWAITNKEINIESEPVPIWELSKQVL